MGRSSHTFRNRKLFYRLSASLLFLFSLLFLLYQGQVYLTNSRAEKVDALKLNTEALLANPGFEQTQRSGLMGILGIASETPTGWQSTGTVRISTDKKDVKEGTKSVVIEADKGKGMTQVVQAPANMLVRYSYNVQVENGGVELIVKDSDGQVMDRVRSKGKGKWETLEVLPYTWTANMKSRMFTDRDGKQKNRPLDEKGVLSLTLSFEGVDEKNAFVVDGGTSTRKISREPSMNECVPVTDPSQYEQSDCAFYEKCTNEPASTTRYACYYDPFWFRKVTTGPNGERTGLSNSQVMAIWEQMRGMVGASAEGITGIPLFIPNDFIQDDMNALLYPLSMETFDRMTRLKCYDAYGQWHSGCPFEALRYQIDKHKQKIFDRVGSSESATKWLLMAMYPGLSESEYNFIVTDLHSLGMANVRTAFLRESLLACDVVAMGNVGTCALVGQLISNGSLSVGKSLSGWIMGHGGQVVADHVVKPVVIKASKVPVTLYKRGVNIASLGSSAIGNDTFLSVLFNLKLIPARLSNKTLKLRTSIPHQNTQIFAYDIKSLIAMKNDRDTFFGGPLSWDDWLMVQGLFDYADELEQAIARATNMNIDVLKERLLIPETRVDFETLAQHFLPGYCVPQNCNAVILGRTATNHMRTVLIDSTVPFDEIADTFFHELLHVGQYDSMVINDSLNAAQQITKLPPLLNNQGNQTDKLSELFIEFFTAQASNAGYPRFRIAVAAKIAEALDAGSLTPQQLESVARLFGVHPTVSVTRPADYIDDLALSIVEEYMTKVGLDLSTNAPLNGIPPQGIGWNAVIKVDGLDAKWIAFTKIVDPSSQGDTFMEWLYKHYNFFTDPSRFPKSPHLSAMMKTADTSSDLPDNLVICSLGVDECSPDVKPTLKSFGEAMEFMMGSQDGLNFGNRVDSSGSLTLDSDFISTMMNLSMANHYYNNGLLLKVDAAKVSDQQMEWKMEEPGHLPDQYRGSVDWNNVVLQRRPTVSPLPITFTTSAAIVDNVPPERDGLYNLEQIGFALYKKPQGQSEQFLQDYLGPASQAYFGRSVTLDAQGVEYYRFEPRAKRRNAQNQLEDAYNLVLEVTKCQSGSQSESVPRRDCKVNQESIVQMSIRERDVPTPTAIPPTLTPTPTPDTSLTYRAVSVPSSLARAVGASFKYEMTNTSRSFNWIAGGSNVQRYVALKPVLDQHDGTLITEPAVLSRSVGHCAMQQSGQCDKVEMTVQMKGTELGQNRQYAFRMYEENGIGYFGPTIRGVVNVVADTVPTYDGTCDSFDPPLIMYGGGSANVKIKWTNTGRGEWIASGQSARQVVLKLYAGIGEGFSPEEVLLPGNVAGTGGQTEMNFTLKAPVRAYSYTYKIQYRLYVPGLDLTFGDTAKRCKYDVYVVPAPTQTPIPTPSLGVKSAICQAFVAPDQIYNPIRSGSKFNVSLTVKNTGTQAWSTNGAFTNNGQNPFELVKTSSNPSFAPINGEYTNILRLPTGVVVRPNESYTFTFTATAPLNTGNPNMSWQMSHRGYGTFGQVCAKDVPVTDIYCTCERADVDQNGTVNLFDLTRVSACVDSTESTCSRYDVDHDRYVSRRDLECVSEQYGRKCEVVATKDISPTVVPKSSPSLIDRMRGLLFR